MASIDKTNRTVLGGIGLILVALLLWSYCGRVDGSGEQVADQAPSTPAPVPAPVEEPVMAPVVALAPVAVEPVTEAPAAEEPVHDGGKEAAVAVMPVVAAAPALSEPAEVAAVAAPALAAASVPATEAPVASSRPELPPVSAPADLGPVPEQDLLIAKASSKRFTPDVAALATAGLSVGVPIQGDENSLNVLQPCDTPASACGAGADPGQVVGGANDWTGFVIPGF